MDRSRLEDLGIKHDTEFKIGIKEALGKHFENVPTHKSSTD